MSKLTVCSKCGWHDGYTHKHECDPERGQAADRLIASINVPSSKLGYGFGCVTFEFSETKSITLRVNRDGSFSIDHFFWLSAGDGFSRDQMKALVEALLPLSKT